MRRSGILVPLVCVVLAVPGCSGSDDEAAPAPPPLPTPTPLDAYRIVYRVEETAGPTPVVTTEVLEVRRPFDARVESRGGEPPGGDITSGNVSSREFFWNLSEGGAVRLGLRRPPGTAHRDASMTVLREAAGHGLVRNMGPATVLGRACTRLAYAKPRPAPLAPPAANERVVACVTADGIVLEEAWTFAGKPAVHTKAVEVDVAPALQDDRFLIGRSPGQEPAAGLGAGAAVVSEGQDPPEPQRQPTLPDGFRLDRRGRVAKSGGGGAPLSGYVESYVRGHELVVVDQGGSLGEESPWPSSEGRPVPLGALGSGRIVFYADRVEVRAVRPAGDGEGIRYFRVEGPSEKLAVAVMRSLSDATAQK